MLLFIYKQAQFANFSDNLVFSSVLLPSNFAKLDYFAVEIHVCLLYGEVTLKLLWVRELQSLSFQETIILHGMYEPIAPFTPFQGLILIYA